MCVRTPTTHHQTRNQRRLFAAQLRAFVFAIAKRGFAFAIVAMCVAVGPGEARADPEPRSAASDAALLEAAGQRARFGGRFEESEAAYRAALAVRPSADAEFGLALSLAAQGKALAAAPLLARLAKETSGLALEDRQRAERALTDVRRELATVVIACAVPGAVVEMNDVPLGQAPFDSPLFLPPGTYAFRARKEDHRNALATIVALGSERYQIALNPLPIPIFPLEPAPRSFLSRVGWDKMFDGPAGAARSAGVLLSAALWLGAASAAGAAEMSTVDAAAKRAALAGATQDACSSPSTEMDAACHELTAADNARSLSEAAQTGLAITAGAVTALTLVSFFFLPSSRTASTNAALNVRLSGLTTQLGARFAVEASW